AEEGPSEPEEPGEDPREEPLEAATPARRGGPWRPDPAVESSGRRPPPRGRRRRLLLYGAAGAILLVGILAVVLLVPSATLTIRAPSKAFSQAVDLTAQPGRGAVSVRAQSIQKQASGTFQSTGQNDIPGAKAAGTIQFEDHCPGPPLQIQQGAIASTRSGVQFVQQQPITIADGETKTAPIQAQSVGTGGNVAAGQITTLKNEGVFASCLKVTNPQPTNGGQDAKQQPVITQQDLSNAQSQLQQQVEQSVQAQLAAAARAGEKEADQNPVVWGAPDFTADHAKGSTVQSFNASLTLKGTSAYYRPTQVAAAFRAELESKVPAGQQLTPNDFTAEYATTGGGGGRLEFKGEAVGRMAPRLDLTAIRSHVAGSSAGAAESYLKGLPVSSSSIAQSPFPLPLLPFLSSRISIDYVIQQPASPTPAPSAAAGVTGH
ncbi:MAG: baseplate J/gp47 family protein, partial [Candidatus Dormibacteraceae bacterium]